MLFEWDRIMLRKSITSTIFLLSLTKNSLTFSFVPSLLKHSVRRNMSSTSSSLPIASSTNPLQDMGLPSPLILGSGSFTRKLILKEMNIDYILKVRPIDEKGIGDRRNGSDPKLLVSTLAKAKGDYLIQGLLDPNIVNGNMISSNEEKFDSNSLHEKFDLSFYKEGDECIVLTADQVVTHADAILEKPKDILEAKSFVERYAESPPATVGAVVLTHLPSMLQVSGVDTATIHFKDTVKGCNLIERLLEDDAPVLDCAGGLMVEHPLVKEHISNIDGTEDSVMGLSKDLVLSLLQSLKEKLESHNNI